jgi:LysR family glycine cleavage system transcriptional activator
MTAGSFGVDRLKRDLTAVSLSFQVTAAAEACGRPFARQILRVSAPTTFALRWRIPRLEQFHAARPQVEVAVTTTTTLHDELRGGFDIAIREDRRTQALGPVSSGVSFLPEGDTLIVSPTLFERGPLHQPDHIASHVLFGSETRPGDWANWLERAGLSTLSTNARQVHNARPKDIVAHSR